MDAQVPSQNVSPGSNSTQNRSTNLIIGGLLLAIGLIIVATLAVSGIIPFDIPFISKNKITPPRVGDGGLQFKKGQAENSLSAYSNAVLKEEYRPSGIVGLSSGTNEARQETRFSRTLAVNGKDIYFTYSAGYDDKPHDQYILIEEKLDKGEHNLDLVLDVFNKYFIMLEAEPQDWKIEDNGKGVTTFEAVFDNPDGSFDTRSSYTVSYKNGSVLVAVSACHKEVQDHQYRDRTCIIK